MENPFPKPPLTPKHSKTLEWIQERIKSPQGFTFHDCLQKVEEAINNNDKEQTLINCYYTTNIIINSKKMSNTEKLEIIEGLKASIF